MRILTVRNNPVVVWSNTTLNNVLLQGNSMHLQSLNSALIVPESDVDLLSVNNLPPAVYASCYTRISDNFSCGVCQSVVDTFIHPTGDEKPTEAETIIDPPIVVEAIEAQTVIDPPIVVEPIEAQTIPFGHCVHNCVQQFMFPVWLLFK